MSFLRRLIVCALIIFLIIILFGFLNSFIIKENGILNNDTQMSLFKNNLKQEFNVIFENTNIKNLSDNNKLDLMDIYIFKIQNLYTNYKSQLSNFINDEKEIFANFQKYINMVDTKEIFFNYLFKMVKEKDTYHYSTLQESRELVEYEKIKYISKFNNENELIDYKPLEFNKYLTIIGCFLEKYKFVIVNEKKQIEHYLKTNLFNYKKNARKNKDDLRILWKIGAYIVGKLNIKSDIDNKIIVKFNSDVKNIVSKYQSSDNKFPFNYDWFIFASYYPTVLCYKIYIDYILLNNINKEYLNEIFKYIPSPNYSKNIIRSGSNVAIMSINFIIGKYFENIETPEIFIKYLNKFFNSDIFKENILLNYNTKDIKNNIMEGFYYDNGFIIHKNLVNYNYLIAYIYPTMFFHLIYGNMDNNFIKLDRALTNFISPYMHKVNPSIVSRYGTFNEIKKNIDALNDIKNIFKISSDKKDNDNYNKITFIGTTQIVIALFDNWGIQLKIPSNILGYGEIDVQNNAILKQIWLNKMILFDDLDLDRLENHSKYPGVISYSRYLEKSEIIQIKTGTKVFTLDYNFSAYRKISNNLFYYYSEIVNKEFKIKFSEFVLMTQFGIIVGYFDIEKIIVNNNIDNDLLLLTINTPLYKNKIISDVLYSDYTKKENSFYNKDNNIVKLGRNILYYNFVEQYNIIPFISEFENKKNTIKFTIKVLNNHYTFDIVKKNALLFSNIKM